MPNTYTQLYIHIVFAVKHREALIIEAIRERIEKYITGIVNGKKQKLYAIYIMPNHLHLLVSINPDTAISDLVRTIKSESTKYINDNKLTKSKFYWQEGFGAFSYSKSQTKNVIEYILNQPEHHRTKSFKEEYVDFLQKFEIEYDDKYLFDWIDSDFKS